MQNIVLIGGAGAPNYGDELIVKGWMDFFREHVPHAHVTFYENIAENEVKLHGKPQNITFQDDLVKVAKGFTDAGFWSQVIRGYHFIDNGGIEKYSNYDLQPLFDADIIHLHGGGYLNNYDPEKGFFIGLLASLKEKFNKKIVATGIGFGPAPEPLNIQLEVIEKIFSYYLFFELRDVDNFRWLKNKFSSANFINGLDDCYLLSTSDVVEFDDSKRRLYLSYLSYNLDKISDNYWNELKDFSLKFDDVLFFESYPWQDKDVFEKVKNKIPSVKKLEIKESLFKKIKVGPHDYAVCARFHVHFMMARAGVQGVYSKDSKYYNVKHQSIIDRGSEMRFTDFSNIEESEKLEFPPYIHLQDDVLHEQKLNLCTAIYTSQ